MAFFKDNLMTDNGGITHHGEVLDADEDLTPTLENTIVVLWLQLIHPGLPLLVMQKYGSELHNKSLASLKPEISQALTSLPEHDRQSLAHSCLLRDDYDDLSPNDCESCDPNNVGVANFVHADDPTAHRVSIVQSPVLHTFYHEHPIQLTLDTGATSNMIRASSASAYRFPVLPASQMTRQADGVTPMDVVGEVHCLICGSYTFHLDALVRKLDVEILAGNPFVAANDIAIRPAKREIVVGGTDVVHYGTPSKTTPHSTVRHTQSFLLRNPSRTVVLPCAYFQLTTPQESDPDVLWALEPRLDSKANLPCKAETAWPQPQDILSVGHTLQIANTTSSSILVKRDEQLCQVRHIIHTPISDPSAIFSTHCYASPPPVHNKPFSASVVVDQHSSLPPEVRDEFRELNF